MIGYYPQMAQIAQRVIECDHLLNLARLLVASRSVKCVHLMSTIITKLNKVDSKFLEALKARYEVAQGAASGASETLGTAAFSPRAGACSCAARTVTAMRDVRRNSHGIDDHEFTLGCTSALFNKWEQ